MSGESAGGSWHDAGPVADFPDREPVGLVLPSSERVCLVRLGDHVAVLHDECTHQGMPLSAGAVLEDDTIECPFHGARFDLTSGIVRRGPAEEAVRTWFARVVAGRVLIAMNGPDLPDDTR